LELIDAIRGRKSIRRFKDRPVSMELVREVLGAANYAPSAKRGEQWRFTVLTGGSKDAFVAFFDDELDKFIEEHGVKEAGSSKNSCRIMGEAPVLVSSGTAGSTGGSRRSTAWLPPSITCFYGLTIWAWAAYG